jgi:mono/diheme cytochrome c family protein
MALPPDRMDAVVRRTADIRPFILAYGWILPVVFLAGVLVFVQAERFRAPLGAMVLCIGLILAGSFEWIRETGRRPWLVPGYMYSNGLTVEQGARADALGINALSGWADLVTRTSHNRGEFLFAQQCGICHGVGAPRMDMIPRASRLKAAGLVVQLQGQGQRLEYMAPMFGNHADRLALAAYLNSLASTSEEE